MIGKVTGQRSPRWAFWSRFVIPCRNDEPYLARLRIIQTPYFGIMLHDIYHDDVDRHPHNHPWSFISVILRGSYVERFWPNPDLHPDRYILKIHRRFSAHRMGRESAHQITSLQDGTKTLILTGPRRASWGFFKNGELVDWKDYERELGTL